MVGRNIISWKGQCFWHAPRRRIGVSEAFATWATGRQFGDVQLSATGFLQSLLEFGKGASRREMRTFL